MTGSDALLDALRGQGVEVIFGNPGSTELPLMDALAARTKLDAVLTSMFGNSDVVDTHRSSPGSSLHLEYGRGRPRPLFYGAAPKILLAHLPRPAMLKALTKEYFSHTKVKMLDGSEPVLG